MIASNKRFVKAALGSVSVAAALIGFGLLNDHGQNARTQTDWAGAPAPASTDAAKSDTQADHRQVLLTDTDKAKAANETKEKTSSVLLNDPFIQTKWGLQKTAAEKAWEITQGSKDIVVAVIDTGIDSKHKDLEDNLWTNPGESGKDAKGRDKSNNGIDDDANGYIDDVHGWNFAGANNSLSDNHGHGTHIAGIIGAHGGKTSGVSGVAPKVSLMILKYYDPKAPASNNLRSTVDAIRYAVKMKAKIINYSGGGTDYSAEEFAAVKEAEKNGVLFVAAAGNEKSNSDEAGKHYYPADYQLSNIISVTAVNKEDTKVLPTSNYGVRTVDLAAPGENIYSTLPNNQYGMMTGTSQATAFVTGVAVLVMAHNRDFTSSDVKKYILRTGDEYATLLSKTGTAKLLNSYNALTKLDVGVSASGVIATNTAHTSGKAFSLEQNVKDPKFEEVAPLGESQEPTASIASFGKEFLKALGRDHVDPTNVNEIKKQ
jgi:subtilisin family serine protease